MSAALEDAAQVVARSLARRRPADRSQFLRELMAHAAAGMVVIDGEREAGEAVYRLADAVVARGSRR